MQNKKGFTLIELLVVIAIIGILSAIVLASLGSARNKANDAKIQSQIASIRAAAEIYNSTYSSYAGIGTVTSADTSGLYNLIQGSSYPGGNPPTFDAAAGYWAAYHPLTSNTSVYACADSSGKSELVGPGQTITTWTAPSGATLCP